MHVSVLKSGHPSYAVYANDTLKKDCDIYSGSMRKIEKNRPGKISIHRISGT